MNTDDQELTHTLSILDQKVSREYLRVAYILPFVEEWEDLFAAVEQLRYGMNETLNALPWLAGRLIAENGDVNGELQLKYKDNITDEDVDYVFRHRCRGTFYPDYRDLVVEDMPPGEITSIKFMDLPNTPDYSKPSAVFRVFANFIPNGLVLVFYVSHAVMDGHGLASLIQIFAKNVRVNHRDMHTVAILFDGKSRVDLLQPDVTSRFIQTQSIGVENLQARISINRRNLDFQEDHPRPECPEFTVDSNRPIWRRHDPNANLKAVSRIAMFDAQTIHELRNEIYYAKAAGGTFVFTSATGVSRWETVAAVIRMSIIRARYLDAEPPKDPGQTKATTRFGFQVNARKVAAEDLEIDLPIGGQFMGNMTLPTYAELPLLPNIDDIKHLSGRKGLRSLAFAVRAIHDARHKFTPEEMEKRFAFMRSQLGENELLPTAINSENGPDVSMTSWERLAPEVIFRLVGTFGKEVKELIDEVDMEDGCYHEGMATHVRKPGGEPRDGEILVLPRRGWGKGMIGAPYEVLISLDESDMKRLGFPKGVGLVWRWAGDDIWQED